MTCQRGSHLLSDLLRRKRNRLFLPMWRSLPPKKRHLHRLPPARLQEGVRDPHHQLGIHHPLTEIGSPTPLHPNAGGTDFISGYRIVFWSRLSGRFRFKRNDGGGRRRRRRSHSKRKKRNAIVNGYEEKMIGEDVGGKFIKVNREVK
jgi:hypothetical protein